MLKTGLDDKVQGPWYGYQVKYCLQKQVYCPPEASLYPRVLRLTGVDRRAENPCRGSRSSPAAAPLKPDVLSSCWVLDPLLLLPSCLSSCLKPPTDVCMYKFSKCMVSCARVVGCRAAEVQPCIGSKLTATVDRMDGMSFGSCLARLIEFLLASCSPHKTVAGRSETVYGQCFVD